MLGVQKRKQVKLLLREQKPPVVARLTGVSLSSVKRIAKEPEIFLQNDAAERKRRRIGRPSKIERYRGVITELLRNDPKMRSIDVMRRARLLGYAGGKTSLYVIVASIRSEILHRRDETPAAVPANLPRYGLR